MSIALNNSENHSNFPTSKTPMRWLANQGFEKVGTRRHLRSRTENLPSLSTKFTDSTIWQVGNSKITDIASSEWPLNHRSNPRIYHDAIEQIVNVGSADNDLLIPGEARPASLYIAGWLRDDGDLW